MNRPNIFMYAQKELSQDAMICWLLECYHSENKKYKQIGFDFIKFILKDDKLTYDEVELEQNSPHKQYYHMDVYANIRVKDKIIPIIFEDKTDTYLHGEQHERYLNMVRGWKEDKWEKWKDNLFPGKSLEWGETRFVFFKTGYIFDWQKTELQDISDKIAEYNAALTVIRVEDIARFIEEYKDNDILLCDYSIFLENKISQLIDCTERKCDRIFGKIFSENTWFNYSYQGWAAKDFAIVNDKSGISEKSIYYNLRTGWRKKDKGYEYAIIMQQCRNEKRISGTKEEKEKLRAIRKENAQAAREICKDIFDELDIELQGKLKSISDIKKVLSLEYNDRNVLHEQNNIFKIFINDENEDDICMLFHHFIRRFTSKMVKKYDVTDKIKKLI